MHVVTHTHTQDKRKALELFQKAADRGSAEGHYFLGKMYHSKKGTGVLSAARGYDCRVISQMEMECGET